MERVFIYCEECDDYLEAEYTKGKWYCENCGKDVTEQVAKKIKLNK